MERRTYARVNARIRARARRTDDPYSPALFRWHEGGTVVPGETELKEAGLPQVLVRYLAALNTKLDALVAAQSRDVLREEYPLRFDVRDISGAGLAFRTEDPMEKGAAFEVVLSLSDSPPLMASAKGKVVEQENSGLWRFEFTNIRDTDLEYVIQFVFQEEREQIRRSKRI
ncbi:MAG: PilZ domain-containing protein [Desulfovibrionaceae bacterium]